MGDEETKVMIALLISLIILLCSLAGHITRDASMNKKICGKLYTSTSDYFKCLTNDIDYTINLIQPLKGELDNE